MGDGGTPVHSRELVPVGQVQSLRLLTAHRCQTKAQSLLLLLCVVEAWRAQGHCQWTEQHPPGLLKPNITMDDHRSWTEGFV